MRGFLASTLVLVGLYRLLQAPPARVAGVLALPATLAYALLDPTVPLVPDVAGAEHAAASHDAGARAGQAAKGLGELVTVNPAGGLVDLWHAVN